MQVHPLGWEDPLEKGTAIHSVSLSGEFHGQRSLASYSPWGHKELDMTKVTENSHTHIYTELIRIIPYMKSLGF